MHVRSISWTASLLTVFANWAHVFHHRQVQIHINPGVHSSRLFRLHTSGQCLLVDETRVRALIVGMQYEYNIRRPVGARERAGRRESCLLVSRVHFFYFPLSTSTLHLPPPTIYRHAYLLPNKYSDLNQDPIYPHTIHLQYSSSSSSSIP
jgi:hypothetical protein